MTEDEQLKQLESLFTQMFDRMDNIEGRMLTAEKDFAEYCDHNPKADEKWAEERLRALEYKVKELEFILDQILGDKRDKTVIQAINEMNASEDIKKQIIDDYNWALSVSKLDKHRSFDNG